MWWVGWSGNEPLDFSMRPNRIRSLEPNGLSWFGGLAEPRLSEADGLGLSVGSGLPRMRLPARGQAWESYSETVMF